MRFHPSVYTADTDYERYCVEIYSYNPIQHRLSLTPWLFKDIQMCRIDLIVLNPFGKGGTGCVFDISVSAAIYLPRTWNVPAFCYWMYFTTN